MIFRTAEIHAWLIPVLAVLVLLAVFSVIGRLLADWDAKRMLRRAGVPDPFNKYGKVDDDLRDFVTARVRLSNDLMDDLHETALALDEWQHCTNCQEPLAWPGHCQNAHDELVKGQEAMLEEAWNDRDAANARLTKFREAVEAATDVPISADGTQGFLDGAGLIPIENALAFIKLNEEKLGQQQAAVRAARNT